MPPALHGAVTCSGPPWCGHLLRPSEGESAVPGSEGESAVPGSEGESAVPGSEIPRPCGSDPLAEFAGWGRECPGRRRWVGEVADLGDERCLAEVILPLSSTTVTTDGDGPTV